LLGLAAACLAFDRFFGLSSGWMRCMLAAQHLQARVEQFHYDWASAYLTGPASTTERLALLREFTLDVGEVVQRETLEWEQEFQSNLARLEAQATLSGRERTPSRRT
jgi:SMODS and SLOG-associating 2TM effector domain 2